MSFTGKKALTFKVAYMRVFGAIGAYIQKQREGPDCCKSRHQLTSPPIGRWRRTIATKLTALTIAGTASPEPRTAVRDAAAVRGSVDRYGSLSGQPVPSGEGFLTATS